MAKNKKGFQKGHLGYKSWLGKKFSDEHRKNLSEAHQHYSIETRQKMSLAKKGKPSVMLGKHHSTKSKLKMRNSRLKYFEEYPEARLRISQTQSGTKDTLEQRKARSEASKGEKSNFWKHGNNQLNKSARRLFMETFEYKLWRENVFERDNYTCQICGERGITLRANHIKRYIDYPELRIVVENGITICESCDLRWVLHKEKEWESYFNFNLGLEI